MFDFIYLFLLPVIFSLIIAIIVGVVNNILLKRKTRKVKVHNISSQPRIIHDNNHKRSRIERLMSPQRDDAFVRDCKALIKKSIGDIKFAQS